MVGDGKISGDEAGREIILRKEMGEGKLKKRSESKSDGKREGKSERKGRKKSSLSF